MEGACRHLIADRLGLTGCHWRLAGAEAVLQRRAVQANDDLGPHWEFHAAREHERLYPPDQHDHSLTV